MASRLRRLAPLLCLSAALVGATHAEDKPKPAGPATVENRVKESELTTIKLTPDAERRLGIELATAEKKPLARTRRFAGEIVIPPGRSVVVAAPVAGLLTLPTADAVAPAAGQRVARGSALLRLQPGETSDGKTFVAADRISLARANADLTAARIEAEGQLEQARVRVEAAEVKLKRADQLRQEGAGAQRALDDARAELNLVQSQRSAAQERVETLVRILASLNASEQTGLVLEAPLDGYLKAVHVTPGLVVASGAPLLEIVAPDPVWVRVPVYVGELHGIESVAAARVRALGGSAELAARDAKRVPAPGSANPLAATVDFFFELANAGDELRPGQRMEIELPSADSAESLVVPYAAILFDIYGGTWVYENVAAQTFTRRRVAIRDVIGNSAVLSRGLTQGAKVVTSGAAELFGTEFGVGK